MGLNLGDMNTPTQITLNITGQLTLHCKNLEPVIRAIRIQQVSENPVSINPTHPGESSFITEMELLKKIPVSRRTIFTWRRSGKIPSVKVASRTLYHWPSVEAALLRCQRGGA